MLASRLHRLGVPVSSSGHDPLWVALSPLLGARSRRTGHDAHRARQRFEPSLSNPCSRRGSIATEYLSPPAGTTHFGRALTATKRCAPAGSRSHRCEAMRRRCQSVTSCFLDGDASRTCPQSAGFLPSRGTGSSPARSSSSSRVRRAPLTAAQRGHRRTRRGRGV
jgi:hypothetical protein